MRGKFVLEIELGNAQMYSRSDIAAKLKEVAKDITKEFPNCEGMSIRDINGNRVGKWSFEKE